VKKEDAGWRLKEAEEVRRRHRPPAGDDSKDELTREAALARNPSRLPCRPSADDAGHYEAFFVLTCVVARANIDLGWPRKDLPR
jgi:hypothetical protein